MSKIKVTIDEENVCIMGLGYVGLTLAATLAELDIPVYGIDKNPAVLRKIQKGKGHFFEKGLDNLLKKTIGKTLHVAPGIPSKNHFNTYITSVGTPLDKTKKPNLNYVKDSCAEIGKYLKPNDLVILRSTVPVGTTRDIVLPVLEKASGLQGGRDFSLVFAPERTVEGSALKELRELPQIIGGLDEQSFIKASNLFRKTTPTVIRVSSLEAAEMIKIMDNTHRDLSFAISNDLALICQKLGLNAVEVIRAANMGYNRTNMPVPSPGVGGACLSKDPYIFLHVAKQVGYSSRFVEIGRKVNEHMPFYVAERVKLFFQKHKKKNPKIFILGFAFKAKPLTSDTRHSPTIALVEALKKTPCRIYGYDPAVAPDVIQNEFGVMPSAIRAGFKQADAVILMLNHDLYHELDIFSLLKLMKRPALFYDGWHSFNTEDILHVSDIFHEGVGFA